MPETPYDPPAQSSASPVDQSKLQQDLAKAKKGRSYTLLLIPVVCVTTALQYTGIVTAGRLPPWFGLVVVGICVAQLIYIQFKIKKMEAALEA